MKKKRVCVIDYDVGNVKSIARSLEKVGADAVLSRDYSCLMSCDAAVLPGVGAFHMGKEKLAKYELIETIHWFVETGKPFLGICLGMQLLLEESEEFVLTKGLGLLKGRVVRIPIKENCSHRVPHIGWNKVEEPEKGRWEGTILEGIEDPSDVYFVHSFAALPIDPFDVLSITQYGGSTFCSSVHRGNVYGCQFHPEKSAEVGLKILGNFVKLISKLS